MNHLVSILLLMVALVSATGATFTESFATQPTGWQVWNPGAFQWDADAQNLAVTWDSHQTNAFFIYKLPRRLTRADAFQVELTLRFDDLIVGVDPTKSSTFPVCFGFVNLSQATRTNYFRGAGVNAATGPRSVVEFAYFAEAGIIDSTVGPIIASESNQIAFSHSHPVEMVAGDNFRIRMSFDAATQTLFTTMWRNGEPYGEQPGNTIRSLDYNAGFDDFEIDAFSITSYSDAGQSPPQYAGSVLAHGIVDDVVITWPDPPIAKVSGHFAGRDWIVEFVAQSGWNYRLQRTIDFIGWEDVANGAGVDGLLQLIDQGAPTEKAFYRVVAERP